MGRTFGKTYVQLAKAAHTATLIALHGLGDTGDGWTFLGDEMNQPHVKFLYPTAPTRPITVNGGMQMPGWFDLDSLDNIERMLSGKLDHEGIEESVSHVKEIIAKEVAAGVPLNRIVVLGFSQGGHVALKTALSMDGVLGGCVALSTWMEPVKNELDSGKKSMPIFVGHGEADPLIPVELGHVTYRSLKEAGMTSVTIRTYRGLVHSSSQSELEHIKDFIQKVIPAAGSCAANPTEEEVSAMSVKELKAFLTQKNVDFSDCIEKGDLLARAKSLL